MEENSGHDGPIRDADHKRAEKTKPQFQIGPWLVGICVGAAWVLPSVAENWNHWWMQVVIWGFGFSCAICVFDYLHRTAHWWILTAILPAVILFVSFAAVMLFAYAGGTMPSYFRSPNTRLVLPVILTILAAISWIRAVSSKRPTPAPASTPAEKSQPATPAPASSPTTTAPNTQAANRFGDLRESILRLHAITATDSVKEDYLRRLQLQVMEMYFSAVDAGTVPPLNPPLLPEIPGQVTLHDWKHLSERVAGPLSPHPLTTGSGSDGHAYGDPPIGSLGWIDPSAALVRLLQDYAASGLPIPEGKNASPHDKSAAKESPPVGDVDRIVNEYVALLDWLETGLRKSADSLRFVVARFPDLALHLPMKPGAYIDRITPLLEYVRRKGIKPNWDKLGAEIRADPEVVAALQGIRTFQDQRPKAERRIVAHGQKLSSLVSSCKWGGHNAVDPFIELESAIASDKIGDDLSIAIAAARKQARRFQASAKQIA